METVGRVWVLGGLWEGVSDEMGGVSNGKVKFVKPLMDNYQRTKPLKSCLIYEIGLTDWITEYSKLI